MKRKLLLFILVALVLGIGVAFLVPTSRVVILGKLRGERFHDGRPVSWWVSSLQTKGTDRKSTRLNSSHIQKSRMPSSA